MPSNYPVAYNHLSHLLIRSFRLFAANYALWPNMCVYKTLSTPTNDINTKFVWLELKLSLLLQRFTSFFFQIWYRSIFSLLSLSFSLSPPPPLSASFWRLKLQSMQLYRREKRIKYCNKHISNCMQSKCLQKEKRKI